MMKDIKQAVNSRAEALNRKPDTYSLRLEKPQVNASAGHAAQGAAQPVQARFGHDFSRLALTADTAPPAQRQAEDELQRKTPVRAKSDVVQRVIQDLVSPETQNPIKKKWDEYSIILANNWNWIGSAYAARPIVRNLIQSLPNAARLDLMANSLCITREIYEHYQNNPEALCFLLSQGADTADLNAAIEAQGEAHSAANAVNLDWFDTNHPASLRLHWNGWFPYTNQQQWNPPTQDAELLVTIGYKNWAVIHVHYGKYRAAIPGNITAKHIKPSANSDERDALADTWSGRIQAVVDGHLAERVLPVLPVVQLPPPVVKPPAKGWGKPPPAMGPGNDPNYPPL